MVGKSLWPSVIREVYTKCSGSLPEEEIDPGKGKCKNLREEVTFELGIDG